MVKNSKRFTWVVVALLLFSYFALFSNKVLAYSPQSMYDDVWKLIKVKYVDAEENSQNWSRWRHKYDGSLKTDQDAYVGIQTMLASLNDPYTRFLDPEEFADEGQSIQGTLFGIGIQIGVKDDKVVVIAPIEDTPAQKAGLMPNDEITEINGISTKGMTVKDAADKIRGKQGTTVNLVVKRGKEQKKFDIMRDKISVKSVSITEPKTVKLNKNVGYIRLNSFISSNASTEIAAALKTLSNKDGYILDLRSNPGGLLTNAINISNMFLKDGVIVSTVDRDGYKDTQRVEGNPITNKPLVIMINEGSASASEILSGALKDNGRAVLVGTKSFGKGLVQEINKLPGGAGVNITTQKYLTPNGTDINKKGIEPDVEVKISEEDIKKNHDNQIEKAQSILEELITQKSTGLSSSNLPSENKTQKINIIIH